MLRVFSHYVSARLVLLVAVEALVLMLAVRFGLAFHTSGTLAGFDAAALPSVATLAVAMMIVMNSMGLYHLDLPRNDWTI